VTATLLVVYLGVIPTAVAFTTWAYALTRTTAGKMGATTYIVPAIVVLMSWALLGQTPRPLAYLGGVLCLAGVAVSRGRLRRAVAPARAQGAAAPAGGTPASGTPAGRPAAARPAGQRAAGEPAAGDPVTG
jgi:hypothetical protein